MNSQRLYHVEANDPQDLVPFEIDWVIFPHDEILSTLTLFCLKNNTYEPYHLVKRDGIWKAVPNNRKLPVSTLDANKFMLTRSSYAALKVCMHKVSERHQLALMKLNPNTGWETPPTFVHNEVTAKNKVVKEKPAPKPEDLIKQSRQAIANVFYALVVSHHGCPHPARLRCEMRPHRSGCVLAIDTSHTFTHATRGLLTNLGTDFKLAGERIQSTNKIPGAKVTSYNGHDFHRITWSISSSYLDRHPTDTCVQEITPLADDIYDHVNAICSWQMKHTNPSPRMRPYGVPECVVLQFRAHNTLNAKWHAYIATRKF